MKHFLTAVTVGVFGAALAFGQAADTKTQTQPQTAPQAQGRGRGGAPFAWGDKNKDGICDVTGRPVGQGRGARAQAGRGRGGCRGGCRAAGQPRTP